MGPRRVPFHFLLHGQNKKKGEEKGFKSSEVAKFRISERQSEASESEAWTETKPGKSWRLVAKVFTGHVITLVR